jgi:hypothetical protein
VLSFAHTVITKYALLSAPASTPPARFVRPDATPRGYFVRKRELRSSLAAGSCAPVQEPKSKLAWPTCCTQRQGAATWTAARQSWGSTQPPHPIARSLTGRAVEGPRPRSSRAAESTRANRRDHRIAEEEEWCCKLNSSSSRRRYGGDRSYIHSTYVHTAGPASEPVDRQTGSYSVEDSELHSPLETRHPPGSESSRINTRAQHTNWVTYLHSRSVSRQTEPLTPLCRLPVGDSPCWYSVSTYTGLAKLGRALKTPPLNTTLHRFQEPSRAMGPTEPSLPRYLSRRESKKSHDAGPMVPWLADAYFFLLGKADRKGGQRMTLAGGTT